MIADEPSSDDLLPLDNLSNTFFPGREFFLTAGELCLAVYSTRMHRILLMAEMPACRRQTGITSINKDLADLNAHGPARRLAIVYTQVGKAQCLCASRMISLPL